jgi:hypothetical protein
MTLFSCLTRVTTHEDVVNPVAQLEREHVDVRLVTVLYLQVACSTWASIQFSSAVRRALWIVLPCIMPSTRPIGPSFDYPGDGAGLGLPFVEHVDLRIGSRVAAKKDAQSLDKIFLELGLQ